MSCLHSLIRAYDIIGNFRRSIPFPPERSGQFNLSFQNSLIICSENYSPRHARSFSISTIFLQILSNETNSSKFVFVKHGKKNRIPKRLRIERKKFNYPVWFFASRFSQLEASRSEDCWAREDSLPSLRGNFFSLPVVVSRRPTPHGRGIILGQRR